MSPSALLLAAVLAAAALPVLAQDAKAPPPAPASPPPPPGLETPDAQASYAIGLNIGANLRRGEVTVDAGLAAQGLKDGLSGATPRLTEDQMRAALTQLQTKVQALRQAKAAQLAADNAAKGAAFLKANAAKAGVVSLPSGLQYEILKAGTGPKPKADDVVQCNYRGTLIDGKEFDSSYKRGEPASFLVDGVIKGWTEALQLMPVGSKWRLYVPADLAYGDKGAGPDIGPNAVLIFEVELVAIQPKG
jgi:FKBP-type peptidyl-prolyl cis-trans isomerase FklB